MTSISAALSTPIQNTLGVGTTAPTGSASAQQAAPSKGDTVTISEEGKALAKGSGDKDGDGSSTAAQANTGKSAAMSKAAVAAALQTAKIKQKMLQNKLADAKAQAKLHPGTASVGGLSARLLDTNRTVKQDMVKVYS